MSLGRLSNKSDSAAIKSWTVAELGVFYSEHRRDLVAHAFRLLRDGARAEEVVQDALIKVMIASPELESTDHALGYMHRTIENLCIDIFRFEGRRPNLVVLDDASSEIESSWVDNTDHVDAISTAEDAAIVRQALAMLSPAERAALVMWEMEGRSSAEIALELGIKQSTVRHTVSRARKSLRRIMSELIIDESRGLTALDLLSTSYKKTAHAAKKSSKAALSLVLVFFAFLGFNSMPTDGDFASVVSEEVISTSEIVSSGKLGLPGQVTPSASSSMSPQSNPREKKSFSSSNVKSSSLLSFAGLDKKGVPTGFTVADSNGSLGTLYVTNRPPVLSETELLLSQVAKTEKGAANIFISQQIISGVNGLDFIPNVSYGKDGRWVPLITSITFLDSERLLSGNYLITAIIKVQSEVETSIVIPASTSGQDLLQAPEQVTIRLVLNPGKTQILSQAVYIVEKGGKL